jgi:hypothetical protein
MTRKILSSLLLYSALILSSCESDQVTTNNSTLEKKLILNPSHLEGEQYANYEFKAKVTNVPYSDLTFLWDLDDGKGFRDPNVAYSQSVWHAFTETRVHNVRVKAYDYFTDSLLGFDSIRVDIRAPERFVAIAPKFLDTMMFSMMSSGFTEWILFSVKTSTPDNLVRTVWDFGDGSSNSVDSVYYSRHSFIGPGIYTVRVSAFEKTTDLYLGTDSATVIIRLPPIDFSEIAGKAKRVSVFLALGTEHPVAAHPLFTDPFSILLPMASDSLSTVTKHSGVNDFQLAFTSSVGGGLPRSQLDSVTARFSADLQTIVSMRVSVNDTGHLSPQTFPGFSGSLRYSYTLHDLSLLAVTNTKIVYRTKQPLVAEFANDITFQATVLKNHPCGIFNQFDPRATIPDEAKVGETYGLVVFER